MLSMSTSVGFPNLFERRAHREWEDCQVFPELWQHLNVTWCAGSQEVWEDGQAFRDLAAQMQAVAHQRETIEAARKVSSLHRHELFLTAWTT